MPIRRAFTLSLYLLVFVGALTLGLAEASPVFVILIASSLAFAYHRAESAGRPLRRLTGNLLSLVLLCLSPLDYLFSSGDAALSLAHLLAGVQVLKLVAERRPRDEMQIVVISLVHVGVAAVLTVDLIFSLLFIAYLTVGVFTLLLFLLVRELARRAPVELDRLRVGRRGVLALSLVTISTLLLTAVHFAIFPRFSAILFQIPKKRAQKVSGFSDRIGLSDLSSIQLSDESVMRVQLERVGEGFPAAPRWRGLAFDTYEGGEWSRALLTEERNPTAPRNRAAPIRLSDDSRHWVLPAAGRIDPDGEPTVYSVTLAPTRTQVLFCVPEPAEVTFLSANAPNSVGVDYAGALLGADLPDADVRYRVLSRPARRTALSPDLRSAYLQLPSDQDLREALAAEADRLIGPSRRGAPIAEQLTQLTQQLREGRFEYTLTELGSRSDGSDPILRFLTETRRGHCELFASAFVLLARSRGVPARLVSGFQAGTWNDFGSFYQVRQRDAHAWAEVFLEGRWHEVDPTPPSDDAESTGLFARLQEVLDYVQLRWMNYVISYSLSDQLSMAEQARRRMEHLRRGLARTFRRLGRAAVARTGDIALLLLGLSGVGALATLVVLLRRRRRRARRDRGSRAAPPPVAFYEALLKKLKRMGHERARAETPREFASRVAAGGNGLGGVPEIVEAFYRVRFGEARLSPGEVVALDAQVAAIGVHRSESVERAGEHPV